MRHGHKVTVLMAVHNEELFIADSVRSILNQTFDDFEFLIINDGSNDRTVEIITSFQDKRVRLVHNEANLGLTASLCKGVQLSNGQYIARIDAGDISRSDRLELQVGLMDMIQEIGVSGSAFHEIGLDGAIIQKNRGFDANDLRIRLICCLVNPFTHPSVVIRKSVLDNHGLNYDLQYKTCQDYKLWADILRYARGHILHEPLVMSRLRSGISANRQEEQINTSNRIAWDFMQREYPQLQVTLEQVEIMRALMYGPVRAQKDNREIYHRAISKYLELMCAFGDRYGHQGDVEGVICDEIRRVAKRLRYTIPRSSQISAILLLLRRNPLLFSRNLVEIGLGRVISGLSKKN